MPKIIYLTAWVLAVVLPCFLSLPQALDKDIVDSIFGSGLDSARYGAAGEEWEEIPVQLLPDDTDCKPIQSPREEPRFQEIHEEMKQIEVIKASANLKCDYYRETQGFECVPYYQCGDDGTIITDGTGLIDIRFGGSDTGLELAILDSTDLMCPGSLDVCCKDPDFSAPTPAPVMSTESPGGYGNGDGDAEDRDNDEDGEDSKEDGEDSKEDPDNDAVCTGYCDEDEKPAPLFKPRCGRRNLFGLGVRIQNYKDGESQFGEWPHICAILKVEETEAGYGATEEVKLFLGGASLISPGVVLTAAHKVQDIQLSDTRLIVRCGEWDTQTSSEPLKHQDREVKLIVQHPKYDRRSLGHTAALLFLEQDFELAEHIDTICLPDIDEAFDEDSECFVKGWGKDKWEQGDYQVVMKEVSMSMVPRQECITALQRTRLGRRFRLDPSFVCAGGEEGQDACKGDGGGPLVCPLKQDPERYVQVGIVAWGVGCGQAIPGVYTSVSYLGCWIDYNSKCQLGDKYQLRYGSECNPWLVEQQRTDRSGHYTCTVHWQDKEAEEVDPYGPSSSGQSLPEKIKIEKTVEVVGGY